MISDCKNICRVLIVIIFIFIREEFETSALKDSSPPILFKPKPLLSTFSED